MPSIKDNIKEELLKIVSEEEIRLQQRMQLNIALNQDNFDTHSEEKFIEKLRKAIESI